MTHDNSAIGGGVRRRADRRRDHGFTYVETVITIVLTGIVVLPILAAVRSSIEAASLSREAAEVETVLINAADRVSRADRFALPELKCDLSGPAEKAASVHGWDASTVHVDYAYWDRTLPGFVAGEACPGGVFESGLVQRVTITVTSPNLDVTRSLEVIKGDY